jgi:hypothetical protein
MEQTFNSGKPPAGEAGMMVYELVHYGDCAAYLRRDGRVSGNYIIRVAERPFECSFEEFKRGESLHLVDRPWRWATLRELTDSGIPEAEARTMVHRSQLPDAPWYPPQVDGYSPWIEGRPTEGLGYKAVVQTLLGEEREAKVFTKTIGCRWNGANAQVCVAHCVELDVVAVGAQSTGSAIASDPGWHDWHEGDTVPSVDRVDVIRITAGIKGTSEHQIDNVVTTSQYWGPNSFVRKWRPAVVQPVTDPNAKMISQDSNTPARSWSDMGGLTPFVFANRWDGAYQAAKECDGALTCAPWTNLLGGWGAS